MILYFTGTGNSKYVASALADKLSDELVSINDTIKHSKEASFTSDKPYIIVSPIYAWRYPLLIEDFIKKATFKGTKDIYFVATMGENTGTTNKYTKKWANEKAMNFKGFRGIVMPNNYLLGSVMDSKEVNEKILADALVEIDDLANQIKNNEVIHKTDKTKMASFLSGTVHNMFTKYMHSAQKYVVNDSCVSCGKCVELCVQNNITLNSNEKPVFGNNCINCLACIQACPKTAINIPKKTENKGRYYCKEYIVGDN